MNKIIKIPPKWKKIKAYGICLPDGLMLGEIQQYKKDIKQGSNGLVKVVKIEIKVIKVL